jgi:hypothetical protein
MATSSNVASRERVWAANNRYNKIRTTGFFACGNANNNLFIEMSIERGGGCCGFTRVMTGQRHEAKEMTNI